MGHTYAIFNAIQDAKKARQLKELFSKPIKTVSPFTISLNLSSREEPKRYEARERFNLEAKDDTSIDGTSFSINEFLKLPTIPKSVDRRALLTYRDVTLNLLREVQSDLNALNIKASLIEHSQEDKKPYEGAVYQILIFVPYTKIEFANGDSELPYEASAPENGINLLSYLVIKGFLDPSNPEHMKMIEDTFPVRSIDIGLSPDNIDTVWDLLDDLTERHNFAEVIKYPDFTVTEP